MNQSIFEIISNRCLTENVYEMVLRGDTAPITASGQFVNIKLEGFYLRRPISVCNVEGNLLTLVYKVVGAGTAAWPLPPDAGATAKQSVDKQLI